MVTLVCGVSLGTCVVDVRLSVLRLAVVDDSSFECVSVGDGYVWCTSVCETHG